MFGKQTSVVKDNCGQAMVEAALTLLLFLMCLFGIFEMGRVLQVRQALTDAAREGARRAIVPGSYSTPAIFGILPNTADVQSVVQSYLQASSIHGATVTVSAEFSIGSTNYRRITVTYPYRVTTMAMFGALNMTLTGQSLMRTETSP